MSYMDNIRPNIILYYKVSIITSIYNNQTVCKIIAADYNMFSHTDLGFSDHDLKSQYDCWYEF